MARTLKSIILNVLKAGGEFVSPGELFRYAQDNQKYKGTQERLLKRAEEMARKKEIYGRTMGRMNNMWFAYKLG